MLFYSRLVFCCFLLFSAFAVAGPGSAVFSSFKDRSLALKESAQISRRFGVEARIEQAVIKGITYHRVLGPVMDQPSVRELVRQARTNGFADAWILSSKQRPVQRPEQRQPEFERREVPETARLTNSEQTIPATLTQDPEISVVSDGKLSQKARVVNVASLSASDSTVMRIARVEDANIKLDGRLDEAIWSEIPGFDRMIVSDPDTLEKPTHQTRSRILYTDKGLFVAAEMEQPVETLVERLSSRDESVNRDDYGFLVDSSGEGLYGYFFNLSLGGSKRDGKIAPEQNITDQWDGPWEGETARTADGWSMEMFIPWSALSMPDGAQDRKIAIAIFRKVAYMDERYSFPALPFSQARFISAFEPVRIEGVDPKQQWEVYPYISATSDEIRDEDDARGGIDLAWRPSSNLQLTATVNPDFGSVESDDVVVNLTAYETFFPEKRLFFLEGTEVFVTSPRSNPYSSSGPGGSGGRRSPGNYSMEPSTLLNTRRIGGAAKQVDIPEYVTVSGVEQSKPTELVGAVKAVGQSGGLRYGLLSAFEKEVEWQGTWNNTGHDVLLRADGRDYGVARLLYEKASGGGRNSIGYIGTLASGPNNAVVHGIDSHLLSGNGKLSWDSQLVMSDKQGEAGYGFFSDIRLTPKSGRMHNFSVDILDNELDISDLGFLRRNDVIGASYRYMKSTSRGLPGWMRNKRIGIFTQIHSNADGYLTEAWVGLMGTWLTQKNLEIMANMGLKPPQYDDRNSRGNGSYSMDSGFWGRVSAGTNSAKKFSFSANVEARSEDLGDITYSTTLGITYAPLDRFSVDLDVGWKKRNEWLIYLGDKQFTSFDAVEVQPNLSMNFFISAKQQLRLKLQWAGVEADQSHFWSIEKEVGTLVPRFKDLSDPTDDFTVSRLTAQLRYRWEIGPLSDLFLVYTRGSNLPNQVDGDFAPLFRDAMNQPIVDVFTMKLRYRFGS